MLAKLAIAQAQRNYDHRRRIQGARRARQSDDASIYSEPKSLTGAGQSRPAKEVAEIAARRDEAITDAGLKHLAAVGKRWRACRCGACR